MKQLAIGCLAVLVGLAVTNGQIVGPLNTAARTGTEAYMNCSASIPSGDSVYWRYDDVNNPGGILIYTSSNNVVRDPNLFGIEVDATNGVYNLIIKSVDKPLGVSFWCGLSLESAQPARGSAELVSIDAVQCPPTGSQVYPAGQTVNVSCSVAYGGTGNVRPMLEWTDGDGNSLSTSQAGSGSPVVALLSLTLEGRHNMMEFRCTLGFATVSGRDTATNIPSYTDSCTTHFLVEHPTSEITIEPKPDANGVIGTPLSPGMTVNCSANGYPEPTYIWTVPQGYTVPDLPFLEITVDMVSNELLPYTCSASNVVNGQTNAVNYTVFFTVTSSPTGEVVNAGTEPWVIAVAVVVPCVVIIIAVVVGVIFYRRSKSTSSKSKAKKNSGSSSSAPFIPATTSAPPPTNRYPPTTATTPSGFAYSTTPRTTPPATGGLAAGGYGDLAGVSLGGSTNRLNQPRPPQLTSSRDQLSTTSSTSSHTRINPVISMRPDPVSPAPRAPQQPVYTQVNPPAARPPQPQRPPSVTSSSSHATSANGSARLNFGSVHGSVHGSIV